MHRRGPRRTGRGRCRDQTRVLGPLRDGRDQRPELCDTWFTVGPQCCKVRRASPDLGWNVNTLSPGSTLAVPPESSVYSPGVRIRWSVPLLGIAVLLATGCSTSPSTARAVTSWSTPTRIEPRSLQPDYASIYGLSCPSSTFCVAVDESGSALFWRSGKWSTPTAWPLSVPLLTQTPSLSITPQLDAKFR